MSKLAAAAPAEDKKAPPFVAAAESRFQTSAEYSYPLTCYTPVAGTPLAHLAQPEYWANLRSLKPGCRIWVMPEDEAWWAELLVRQSGPGYAKVQLLRHGELDKIEDAGETVAGYRIEWVNTKTKHRVVRVSDGQVIKEGLADKSDAHKWLADHRKALAA